MPIEIPEGWQAADERPTTGDAHQDERTEQCPTCLAWLKPKQDGTIRKHGDCAGWNAEDERPHMVIIPSDGTPNSYQTRFKVTGRRSAEVIARKHPTAMILKEA